MPVQIGHVEAIFRYPVKSMGGERLEAAMLGWHGLEDDRRLAFRRLDDRSGFPWLTAVKLHDLVLFTPHRPGAEMLKAVVRMHENTAGIYGAVTRVGRVEVGQRVFVGAPSEVGERGLTEA